MHLDLHLHTTCSDGSVTPEALVVAAEGAGLHAIAVTDHDTTAGVEPARRTAEARGRLTVVAGTELTCSLVGREAHLLAYGIDPAHAAMGGFVERGAALRRARLDAMLGRLRALGVVVGADDVELEAECAAVGRPHLARALVRTGAVESVEEAFTRYLGDGRPAYVPSRGPDVREGIAAIAAAGGLSVWAHPALEDAREFARLRELGLDGVEALRPSFDPATSIALERAAREHGLVVTGGSDWHGGSRPPLGAWFVTEAHVGAFLERLGLRAR